MKRKIVNMGTIGIVVIILLVGVLNYKQAAETKMKKIETEENRVRENKTNYTNEQDSSNICEITEEAYEANLTKEIIPSYWIDLDKIDTFSDTNTAIKDFFEQQQAQFVCGELDIDNDADWQAYVDGMYSLGLEDWVATQGIEEIAK